MADASMLDMADLLGGRGPSNGLIAQYALRSASPSTIMAAQQNEQIANMLQGVQAQGVKHSSSIGAMAANLMADALDQRAMNKSNAGLVSAGAADQNALAQQEQGSIGLTTPTSPGGDPADVGSDAHLMASFLDPSGGSAGAAAPATSPAPSSGSPFSAFGSGAPALEPTGGAAMPAMGAPQPSGQPPPMQTAQAPPGAQGFGGAAAPAADPASRVGPPVTPQDRDALIRMTWGEARGEQPSAQAATAAVALNRSLLSGQPVSAVVNAPGQFEGMAKGLTLDPRSPEYQRIAAVVDPLLSGNAQDPSGGATHFYSPGAQAALGRQAPAWANGQQGRQIGNQLFYNLAYRGQSAAADPQPAAGPDTSGAQLPAPQTLAPQGPQSDPQLVMGRGPSPQEAAFIQQAMSSPYQAMREQGMQMIAGIRARMNTPIKYDQQFDKTTGQTVYTPDTPGEGPVQYARAPLGYQPPAPDKTMYDSQGVLRPIAGTTDSAPVRVSPSATAQSDPFGHVTYSTVPGLAGEPPAGTVWTGSGYAPLQGSNTWTGPGAPGSNGLTPVGQLLQRNMVTGETRADPRLEPAMKVSGEAQNAPEVKEYSKLLNAYQGISNALRASTRNNGMLDTSFTDATGQVINPGRAMTVGSTKLWLEHFGLPAEIEGHLSNLLGNGYVTPQTMQQGLSVMNAYARGAYQQADSRLGAARDTLKTFGVEDPALTITPPPAVPDVPWMNSQGGGAVGGGGSAGVQTGNGGSSQSGAGAGAGGVGPSSGGVAGSQARLSPAEAARLPSGTGFYGLDGKWRVRH